MAGTSVPGRLLWLFVGLLAGLLLFSLPLPGLNADAHTLACILLTIGIYWVTEPIPLPITALLGTALCVLTGLGSMKVVFASYGHPVIFLFIGSFLLAEGLTVHKVDQRFADWILSRPWIQGGPERIMFAFGGTTAGISMWMSNTAATALMLPICLGIVKAGPGESMSDRRPVGLLLLLSYAATAGGMATVIGTPPNVIGVGLIAQHGEISISFLTWMTFGVPLSIFLLIAATLLLSWRYPFQPPAVSTLLHGERQPQPWTPGAWSACLALGVAVVLWLLPGLAASIMGPDSAVAQWLEAHLPTELAALLAAFLLFVLPGGPHTAPALSWRQATNINWGVIVLFGGGLAFGELMLKTGLSDAIGRSFVAVFGSTTLWTLTALAIVTGVIVSELASNTASATLLIPTIMAIADAQGVSSIPPALGACFGASLGFALPVSTPPNALVYATGYIPMMRMISTGLLFDVIGAAITWVVLRLVCPLLGYQ